MIQKGFLPYVDEGIVLLPKMSQEWLIGGRSDVESMIRLLQRLLERDDLKP